MDEALVVGHIGLAVWLAEQAHERFPKLELEELIGEALLALCEAGERYDERGGAAFDTFAKYRVRGQLVDRMRLETLQRRGYGGRGRTVERIRTVSLDIRDGEGTANERVLHDHGAEEAVTSAVGNLFVQHALSLIRPRQRAAIVLHDLLGLSEREAGQLLGVSESRVSQLRTAGLVKLRPLAVAA